MAESSFVTFEKFMKGPGPPDSIEFEFFMVELNLLTPPVYFPAIK